MRRRWTVCVLLLLVMVLTGCRKEKPSEAPSERLASDGEPKVWVIGFDGFTWHVALPLILKGDMPNLEGLMREGSYGHLMSLEVMCSPNVWTSIVTGKVPEKHGITHWTSAIPGTDAVGPISNSFRKVRALWNILSERDRSVGVVGFWTSWPAEEVNGFVVTDHFSYSVFNKEEDSVETGSGQTYPPHLGDELQSLAVHPLDIDYDTLRRFMIIDEEEVSETLDVEGSILSRFRLAYGSAVTYEQAARALLPQYNPDFFVLYLQAPDIASHCFWQHMDPKALDYNEDPEDDLNVPIEDIEKFGATLQEVYRFSDEQLGRLLELAPEDATIIVCSDHGFGTYKAEDTDIACVQHKRNGLLVMKGKGIRKNHEIQTSSVLDITPTILTIMGLPVARDMDGKVLVEVFDPAYLDENPIQYCDTYETTPYEAPPFQDSPVLDRKMEELRGIGYIGGGKK